MEANTPGQNMLLGMSGHDGGRLHLVQGNVSHAAIFLKFLNTLQEEGLMQLSWPQSEPRMYKSNQTQEHYFIIGN